MAIVREAAILTVEDFDRFALEYTGEEIYEYIEGELIEVPTNFQAGHIAGLIVSFLNWYLRQYGQGGLAGVESGFMVDGQRFAPDVAYIGPQKRASHYGYNPDPPDLAVEVISDESNRSELAILQRKLRHYRAAGVTVWVVWPRAQRLDVHLPGAPGSETTLGADDTLAGGEILPGFQLPLREIFRDRGLSPP